MFEDIDFWSEDKNRRNIIAENKKNKKELLAKIKYKEIICKKANSFKEIVGSELKKDIQYRIISNKSFNAITVIQYLLEFYNIEEIYIAVFRMNNKSFNYLKDIIEKDKIKAAFLVSVFFAKNKRYIKWAEHLKDLASKNKNVKVAFANIHAKVFLTRTRCNKHIVFEGSGNLSHNEAIEQYVYEDNKQTYNFHKNWIDEILNK